MKRFSHLLFVSIFFMVFARHGKTQNILWEKNFGGSWSEDVYDIIQTQDEGFVFIGNSGSTDIDVTYNNGNGNGTPDYWVVKIDQNQNLIWQKSLGSPSSDRGTSIVELNDGGFLVGGHILSNGGDVTGFHGSSDAWIAKLDSTGNMIWEKCFGGTNPETLSSMKQTPDGGFILVGSATSNDGDVSGIHNYGYGSDMWVLKLDSNGNLDWQKCLGGPWSEGGESIEFTTDGGYIIAGYTSTDDGAGGGGAGNDISYYYGASDFWIVKLDINGNIIWNKSLGGALNDKAYDIKQTFDGGYIVVGSSNSMNGIVSENNGDDDIWIVKLDSIGNLIWEKSLGGSNADRAYSVVQAIDGGFIVAGETSSFDGDVIGNNGSVDIWIVKLDALGNMTWQKTLGGSGAEYGRVIKKTLDNGFVIAGSASSNDGDVSSHYGGYDSWIVKMKEPNIRGNIFYDASLDCIIDEFENPLNGINLSISPGNHILTTDVYGTWYLDSLPSGTYTVTLDTTNLNWSPTCPVSQTFTVTDPSIFTLGPNFGLIDNNPCTDPDVSIFTPSLRRCFSNRLVYVSACNSTTATATLDSSYVDVELDPLLIVNSASLPYTDLGNNTFRFETGDIYPGQCVNFTLSTNVSCNAQNGQTLCMDATLYPAEACIFDTIPSEPITNDGIGGTLDGLPQPCTLPWDQSSLSVEGWCTGDSVYFSITNTGELGGGDMECYSPVWLTVDGVVTDTDSLMIQGGETVIYAYPASGQTFFLNAEQHPLHPGNSHPNAHVELCGDSTNWTPGIVNQFPQDDADPDVDIYCGQVTAPVDPNDKTGYPLGQTEAHYVQPNQQLQYVARFQNTGTDTAVNVVVRDTLDLDLNIFTVTPGVASHPYTFRMYGPRVLEWTFENINLPDSTTNLEESNGFLTFHVDQVPNLTPGTVINNSVDIYFDFELPITTNTTEHVIYEGFVSVLSVEDLTEEGKDILVYPNPTTNLITIQSENVLNNSFKIFDQNGREVLNGKLNGKSTEVSLSKLSKGMYTLQVDGNYKSALIIKQ